MICIAKIFKFSAGHWLPYHQGLCKGFHGHNFVLEIEMKGDPKPYIEVNGVVIEETGMIMDFGNLKRLVNEAIIEKLDHKTLNDVFMNPTAENLVVWIRRQLRILLDKNDMALNRIRLWETDTSYAEWRRE